MRYKNFKSIGLAVGALALCGLGLQAKSDDAPMSMSSTMTPVAVTGTVDHFYADSAGYVTAVDIKTTDGDKWVHFAPSMAQRVMDTYPVGSTASIYVTQGARGWNLASLDATPPTTVLWTYPYTGYDVLKSPGMTTIGAPLTTVSGKLTGFVADKDRSILAIVLDGTKLVRIPEYFRQETPPNIPEGVTPLFRGSDIVAVGYPEAHRYGALSPFETRIIPTAVSVNGRSLGELGFGKLGTVTKPLFNFNIGSGITGASPHEINAGGDYMVYEPTGTGQGAMTAPVKPIH